MPDAKTRASSAADEPRTSGNALCMEEMFLSEVGWLCRHVRRPTEKQRGGHSRVVASTPAQLVARARIRVTRASKRRVTGQGTGPRHSVIS